MNKHVFFYVGLGLALVIISGMYFKNYAEHEKAMATVEAQKANMAQSEKAIGDIRKEIQESHAVTAQQIAALDKNKQTIITTPSMTPEVLALILKQLGSTASPKQTAPTTSDIPDSTVTATLTKKDEIELTNTLIECKKCTTERDGYKTDITKLNAILAERDKQLIDSKTALDTAIHDSKPRFFSMKTLKPLVCATAGAWLGSQADKRTGSSGKGVAIGSVVGWSLCKISSK